MILIDAKGLVMGRLASAVAKKALQNEEVVIVNAEKVVVTGTKKSVMQKFQKRFELAQKGNPRLGPKFSRMPDRIVRHSVRGMLPYKRSTGKTAFRKVKVFIGIPKEFEGKEFTQIETAKHNEKVGFVILGDVCKLMGAKW